MPGRSTEQSQGYSASNFDPILRAAYQQVLGEQYVLESDRLMGVESLLRDGDLSVRDLVRSIARRNLYPSRFPQPAMPTT